MSPRDVYYRFQQVKEWFWRLDSLIQTFDQSDVKTKREFNLVISGKFRTFAMFFYICLLQTWISNICFYICLLQSAERVLSVFYTRLLFFTLVWTLCSLCLCLCLAKVFTLVWTLCSLSGPDPAAGVTRHSQGCLKGGERREGWRGGQTDFFKSHSHFHVLINWASLPLVSGC